MDSYDSLCACVDVGPMYSCFVLSNKRGQSLNPFVAGPPLDPVVQCHHGMTQACEGPLLPRITPQTDPVECTLHSEAAKSICLFGLLIT